MAKKEISYKEAYAKLENILQEIEGNEMDVDQLSIKIKEAAGLLNLCKDKLFVASEETKKILAQIK
ncbi:hypothetical protein AwDysgo_06380 [Bacteroidales bacterium]|nr:hypothetical protein AwDysgo_06380 [Bacteroidales bacterium]